MVGAVLTQNTAWTNVEKAIINLKAATLMDMAAIDNADVPYLASLLKPSGYYNIKTSRLKNLIRMIMTSHSGDLDDLFSLKLHALRTELLGVSGIGKETADSICCYAADKCIFVVDAYTRRILMRHGIITQHAGYDEIQSLFEAGLSRKLAVYKDIHAHIVYIGKDYCRTKNPRCDACPLNGRL
jgi:endonuclease-3 related protein